MPTYELPLLLRVMSKPETTTVLKRTAQTIFNTGGFIRKIDNLGRHATPYKMKSHGKKHNETQNFLFTFDAPPSLVEKIHQEYVRDIDIVKSQIFQKQFPDEFDCQLDEETRPAPYRKDVQKMMSMARRRELKNNFKEKYFKNLKDFPFQT